MKLLVSKKFTLPKVYFVTDREELKEIPIGVPFIFGDAASEKHVIRILEYEVLYQEALKSGFPFNWKKILKDNGYTDIKSWSYAGGTVYLEYTTEGLDFEDPDLNLKSITSDIPGFKAFIKDSAVYVDIQKLKALNIFPVWLDTIEEAIHTNIHNFAVFNENMYNKKLEGMYGGLDLVSPNRNLIIIDISGSIPRGVSSTCLALAQNLAETFYADLLITGSKSTLYSYENLLDLDITRIYNENGMDNDQVYFRKLVTQDERKYKTAIIFGDNHSPCYAWCNEYNKKTNNISREDGKKMCRWQVEKIISFHTDGTAHVAGYGDWFEPETVQKIDDWVKYLN